MKWLVLVLALTACEHGKGGGTFDIDGGTGAICGGFGGTQCGPNEWCDFSADDCGGNDGTGVCKRRPIACDDSFDPVCGCDGVVHSNPCDGQAVGADINILGGCRTEVGFFACGSRQCALSSQYCQRVGSDIGGEPDSFECKALPAACEPNQSCDCLFQEPCGTACSGDEASGLTVICLGG